MLVSACDLPEVLHFTPRRIQDSRGYFSEIFKLDLFHRMAGAFDFVQENESLSVSRGTVRGLHFQTPPFAQGKLVRCLAGALLDVAVDIRHGSPTFGQWVSVELTSQLGNQLWIPPGFAHGFCTTEPNTVICYKVTAPYSGEHDRGVAWDDPEIGMDWPGIARADLLSSKDAAQPRLKQLPAYFSYQSD